MSTGKRTAVFSIATASHLARVRVLMASLQQHAPAWERHLCLADRVDGRFDPAGVGAELTLAEDLELPAASSFFQRYDAFEACCALKPLMARRLFERGYEQVVYLDADIEVYSPFVGLDALLDQHGILLTPHRLGPPADAQQARVLDRSGKHNAGFFALARQPESAAFLDWWAAKLAFGCRNAQDDGVFVDQRWLDEAPQLFPGLGLLRDPGCNVAHWNLDERPLGGGPEAWSAGGGPLVFFHFSGFDRRCRRLTLHSPSTVLAEGSPLAQLTRAYADRLEQAGEEVAATFGWALGLSYEQRLRASWRRHLPPFRAWLLRKDLRLRFPRPMDKGGLRLWKWYLRHGVGTDAREMAAKIPGLRSLYHRALLTALKTRAALAPEPQWQPGVDLVGYLRSENGVGEACRLAAQALTADGVPFSGIDVSAYSPTANLIDDWQACIAPFAQRRVALLHVNGNATPHLPRLAGGRGLFRGQRHIGVWHWELPVLPASQAVGLRFVDELWAPSRFIQTALEQAAPRHMPVLHMPHAVHPMPDSSLGRRDLGLPDGRFVFTSFYDANSYPERKNPLGALRAFQAAFRPDDERVFLLIKANQGDQRPEVLARLGSLAAAWPNIKVWDATLSRGATHRLIQLSDAVLSLHRSEGFGLVMAEAMAMGRVAVATGWSGNMDFMNEANSVLVPFELQRLKQDHGPYEAWQTWAEPDVDQAARLMRRLVEDPAWTAGLAQRGQAEVAALCSPQAAGRRMRERLQALGAL